MSSPFQVENLGLEGRNNHLEGYSRRRWEGEILASAPAGGEILIPPINFKKLKVVNLLVVLLILLLFGRTLYLQVIRGDDYYYLAEGRHVRLETIKARRGLFYDRNNKLLIKNIPSFSLNVIPANLPKKQNEYAEVIDKVSQLLPADQRSDFLKTLEDVPKFALQSIPILRNLDYQTSILLKVKIAEINAFEVVLDNVREYEDAFAFSHLFGHLGKISPEELTRNKDYQFNDLIGKTGLEFFYENQLRGQNGQWRIEINPPHLDGRIEAGRSGKEEVVHSKPAVAGDDLILSIDAGLQKKLFETLSFYTRQFGGKGGAVAINPNNGEILAIVSFPSYDNNRLSRGLTTEEFNKIKKNPAEPLFFRTIAGQYPSGSTIKPILAVAGLEEKIITPQTTILSSGGISVGKWFFADWKIGGHGLTNVIKALAESVNTFFYYLGGGYGNFSGLGIEKMNQWFRLFGLGDLTGVDLSGEKSGFLPTPEWKEKTKNEIWYPGDTYHLAIGQGDILVTLLQVANYTAAIANGGTLYQPHIVMEINNSQTEQSTKIQPKILRSNFVKEENLKVIREGMRAAVVWGSARGLSGLPIKVAGKTGTAQAPVGRSHAWFTCFAPYEKPEIVLTVLIENGGEGSAAALPVARDVLNWWWHESK